MVDFDDKDTIGQIGTAIKEALAEQGKGKWVGTSSTWLGNKAVEAIDDAVGGIDLIELFGKAWSTAKDLQSRADAAKYPSGKPHYVKLGQHTVKFDVRPTLVVSLGAWSSEPVAIVLELSALIKAMELRICDGHITSIHGGSCDVGLNMTMSGVEVMKRKTLKKFTLDVEHAFASPGLRLAVRDTMVSRPDTSTPATATPAAS